MADQNGRIHSQVAELLSAYIDDEVSVDERALVEEHLVTCDSCVQDLTTLRQTVALLGELPQVAAPRPFTLRESDVRPVRDTDHRAWWRLPWAQGLVGAAAVLLCVVVVGGVVLLGRGGMVGAPAAPNQIALEALPAADDAANAEMAVETVEVEAETVVEAEKEEQPAVEPAAPPPEPASEEAPTELGMAQEAPAEEAPLQQKSAADEGEAFMATQPARAASRAVPTLAATPAPMPTATPAPTTTPGPAAEALPAAPPSPTPTLLEVEELSLEIDPGVIRARGRIPLSEGSKLLAVLWRDGQPITWATLESQRLVVEADGQFYLVLIAKAETPDRDLFAAKPADYEIRIRPVDPPAPVEIRIPFDTYGPPPPAPTSAP